MKKILITLLVTAFTFASCERYYTCDEVKQFKKGDTIYVYLIDKTVPAIVVKNDTIQKLVTIKVPNYYDANFDRFWIERIKKYREL